ncbi:Na+/H+ antiporter [Ramlibacter henchirensis]|uniref:Na+/H+ antiporter n=1 Tax=Ramlibacter henchirensis TaxID=204072 RepID=A0A4Z0C6F8_9BURK|nr:Na+/H+ antiporter [Ramlibacter henchirensis]TFZ06050.1 Na+/H+ antiporter [Ramlibacter henchirensis]
MALFELLLVLLLSAVALGWVARHFKFPYPIALVAGGALLGLVPNLPQHSFDPQLILVAVLPPILYQAALLTSWTDFKANLRPIGLLAIGLVAVTTLAVGAALKLMVPSVPWAAAFVLGAIVSPPDAVAATAILSRLNMPRRIVTILEGESLVNDASGLVLYKFAVAAVLTGAFSLVDATVQFALVSVGGIAVGVVLAFIYIAVHKRLGDPFIEVLTVLTIPYAAYLVAEAMNLSGVLAVVVAGLVRGRYAPEIVSAEMRIMARSVWNLLVFLLNSLVFILIGLQMSDVLAANLGRYPPAQLAAISAVVTAVAIGVRFAWVFAVGYLPERLTGGLREQQPRPNDKELVIIGWCGMRGIVSLAAALALPLVLPDFSPFPHRDLIVFLTFVVIVATLVGQGLTLTPLIRLLKVGSKWSLHDEQRRVRAAMSTAALAAIDRELAAEGVPSQWAQGLKAEITERIELAASERQDLTPRMELVSRLRHAAIAAERGELIRLWRDNQIGDEVMHHLMEMLDYEQARLPALRPAAQAGEGEFVASAAAD